MNESGSIYFHSPCFDGIVSCVIASDFLENSAGWRLDRYLPVDYDARQGWLSSSLDSPCAVVDFLYHPRAAFWADHHATTFITEDARNDFESRKQDASLIYDSRFGSCAMLLWERLDESFGFRNPRHHEMVQWADKIDAARYQSVDEAILGDSPALQIRASLGFYNDPAYFERLVSELRVKALEEVAKLPEVRDAAAQSQSRVKAGLQRLEKAARLEDGEIAVFDIASGEDVISRYAPYYFFPRARYSIGIVRSEEGAKITGMRNPWREFPSVPLGKIFEKYGGGGHQRVGALLLPVDRRGQASSILESLLDDIRRADRVPELERSTV
jgi:hypothetical protein